MSVKGKASVAELSKLIDANLLAAWLKELKASGVQRDDLMKESELQQQCSEFVDLLRTAAQSGNPEVRSPAGAPVREFLEQISRSRAIQGATPTQIATFVFSLKRPLFDRVRSEAGKDVDLQADQVWAITQLVDELGLLTLEAFQKTREDVIGRQQQEMLELSTPVVKLWDGVLALPMIGTLDSARTQVVMETLLQRIVETGAEIAIIDITGVPTVDTLVAQHLLKTITAARLMGADCIISGIRPQIAQTIVHLGVDLADVITKASLADAFALALKRTGVSFVKSAGVPSRRERMDRIPILRMGKLLLVTIQVDMHDRLAMTLQDDLTAKITQTQARGVLIDISSLEMVDSFIGRMLANIAAMSRVLDAQTVVVGMQPAVAITLVELGMSLPGVRMALNVERGMDLLQASLKEDLAVEGDDASRQE